MSNENISIQIQRFKGLIAVQPENRKAYLAEIAKLEAQLKGAPKEKKVDGDDEKEADQIREELTSKGIKFNSALGLKKLRLLLEDNK